MIFHDGIHFYTAIYSHSGTTLLTEIPRPAHMLVELVSCWHKEDEPERLTPQWFAPLENLDDVVLEPHTAADGVVVDLNPDLFRHTAKIKRSEVLLGLSWCCFPRRVGQGSRHGKSPLLSGTVG